MANARGKRAHDEFMMSFLLVTCIGHGRAASVSQPPCERPIERPDESGGWQLREPSPLTVNTRQTACQELPIFVVNRQLASARRAEILAQRVALGDLCLQRWPAVDGVSHNFSAYERSLFEQRGGSVNISLHRGVAACALSHFYLHEYLVSKNITGAVVLEDDVVLADNFMARMSELYGRPKDADLIYLVHNSRRNATVFERLVRSAYADQGTRAYFITARGAGMLSRFVRSDGFPFSIDVTMLLHTDCGTPTGQTSFRRRDWCCKKLNVYHIHPPTVRMSSAHYRRSDINIVEGNPGGGIAHTLPVDRYKAYAVQAARRLAKHVVMSNKTKNISR